MKGQGIWTTSGRRYVEHGCADLVLGFSGCLTARSHDVILAEMLERLVEGGWR